MERHLIRSEFLKRSATALGLVFVVLMFLVSEGTELLLLGITIALLVEWTWLVRRKVTPDLLQKLVWIIGGCYITVSTTGVLLFVRSMGHIHYAALYLFLVIWLTDTSSYLIGSILGGPKLLPRVSPNKTWSGSIGGLFSAITIIAIFKPSLSVCFFSTSSSNSFLLMTAAISVAAQIGDLAESSLKRCLGIREVSNLLPGHGGLLDRLDSLLGVGFFLAAFFFLKENKEARALLTLPSLTIL